MRWPWETRQVPTETTAGTGGHCEKCGEYGMIALPSPRGWRMLCWEHYCAEQRAARASGQRESAK